MAAPRILFLCTHNSARSQMAEAILRHRSGGAVEAASAGTEVTRVHPLAVAAMAERGISLAGQRSKQVEEFAAESFDVVITVCDHARETCPFFPRATRQLHWSLPDPSAATGSEEERLEAFRRVAGDLEGRIEGLLQEM